MAIDFTIARRWTNADAVLLAAVREHAALEGLKALLPALEISQTVRELGLGDALCGLGHEPAAAEALILGSTVERRLAPFAAGVQGTSVPAAAQAVMAERDADQALFGTTGVVVDVPAAALRQRQTYKSIVVTDPRGNKGGTSGVPPRGRPDPQG